MSNESINNGGPAFPTPAGVQHNDGMTLRDYFAGKTLQGIFANPESNRSWNESNVAQFCYCQADEMLKAREAK